MTTAAVSKYSSGMPPDSAARGRRVGCIRMPIAPAPPSSSAHSDQPVAAITPSDTSVSMVDEPCRPARAAARWNGQADQVATGRASAATTHCQPSNCSGGTIESATTGTVSTDATTSRRRRSAPRASPGSDVSSWSAIDAPSGIEWPDSAISRSWSASCGARARHASRASRSPSTRRPRSPGGSSSASRSPVARRAPTRWPG